MSSHFYTRSPDETLNFAYEYDNRGNIVQENRNGKVTTYTYDALGQLIRVNDPNDPTAGEGGTTWLYNYDRGGNILSKSCHRYTTGTPGVAHDTILYSYTDNNWKDKLTAYDGQTITYDAIGNPLNDGRRRYEWQAGRQLKKVYVKADLKEGTKPGVDEQSGTVLKIAWSNGNLLDGEVTSTQASAEVTRNGEDVTSEYAASAFAWKRDSGNAEADATWNAAHAGMKTISLTEADLNGNVKITCTLTGNGPSYGSIAVDEDMDATHTRGTLDANDTFQIVNGELKVTTSRGNVYALEDGKVKGAGAKLNGSLTAETKLFASQPEDMVEFSYDHNGLRTQKKVTKADGTVETTEYTLYGKLIMHLTRGSDEMHFFYDKFSNPLMVKFNGEFYCYIRNVQGDVMGLHSLNGEKVTEYNYDAWGNLLAIRISSAEYEELAMLNPFRYRSYVWDLESELYYLRNRYYGPERKRFINSDIIISRNVFSICYNSAVNFLDANGMAPTPAPLPSFPVSPHGTLPPDWAVRSNEEIELQREQERIHKAMIEWARERSKAAALYTDTKAPKKVVDMVDNYFSQNGWERLSDVYELTKDGHTYYRVLCQRPLPRRRFQAFSRIVEAVYTFEVETYHSSMTWGDVADVALQFVQTGMQYGADRSAALGMPKLQERYTMGQAGAQILGEIGIGDLGNKYLIYGETLVTQSVIYYSD